MQATSPPSPHSGKDLWRRWLRAQVETDPAAGGLIREEIAGILACLPPSRIAAFSGMADEPDLWPLVECGHGHEWLMPRIDGLELVFHPMKSRAGGIAGVFGIIEPPASSPSVRPEEIDLVLCPGLGFGRDLSRLGRGKGYYDRLLARLRPGTPMIGVAYPCRIVDAVPTDAHDIPMTWVIGV